MKIELSEHYRSMSLSLAPGIHDVPESTGQYLIDNGYVVAVIEEIPNIEESPVIEKIPVKKTRK